MSLSTINDCESIYNLIPKPHISISKEKRYKSKYNPKGPLTGSTFGLHGTTVTVGKGINELKKTSVISSTFGPRPSQAKVDTSNFLRKRSNLDTKSGEKKEIGKYESERKNNQYVSKPPVPLKDEKPVMGIKTCKNFIASNAVGAILKVPPSNTEDKVRFMEKENYGKIPEYLSKVKREMQREKHMIENCLKSQQNNFTNETKGCGNNNTSNIQFEEMDDELRQKLVDQLKKKWDQVNAKYQKICHRVTIDSLGDKKRKEAQEAELQQLEDYIEKLSKPVPLYIRHTN